MFTRCPECATRFRFSRDQLEAAGGRVRCGKCGCVFTALRPVEPHPPISGSAEVMPQVAPRARHSIWSALGWGLLNLLLVAALVLQWLWWERDALAADPDGLRVVQYLCRYADCEVQPPRAPEQIEILERSLLPDEEHTGVLHFHLRMVNRADHAQPHPIIELSLSDRIERSAGERRFAPKEYLPGHRPQDVMEPGALVDVDLDLVDPGAHVIGFQIDFL
jgi:predicted Zn finger-like uncharacterized protein